MGVGVTREHEGKAARGGAWRRVALRGGAWRRAAASGSKRQKRAPPGEREQEIEMCVGM